MPNANAGLRLAVMMFLQFFVWGSWYVAGPSYLGKIGFAGADFGTMYSVGPIAGMISPLFVGLFADRFFAAQRLLGVLHLLGAAAMWYATTLMLAEKPSPSAINWAFFAHMLCYYPTLALTNTLAMRNLSDTEKQFPLVRVFGTLGWIAAGAAITALGWAASVRMFQLAAGASLAMGLYSFLLPHTPPVTSGPVSAKQALGLDALELLKDRSYAVFLLCSFLICIPLAFYYQLAERAVQTAGIADATFKMTFGQMSEVLFMAVMPLFLSRLGVKWMLAVGMAAWVIRYVLFSAGVPTDAAMLVLVAVALHGICYDFFFVTGQIYTDQSARKEIRGQAQGFLVLCTLGLGMFIGAKIAGQVEDLYKPAEAVALLDAASERQAELTRIAIRFDAGGVPDAERVELETRQKTLEGEANTLKLQAYEKMDWGAIWRGPAIGAAAVLLIFLALFRGPERARRA
ncbi:MAG: MFS transporter [Planctomycetes bacterium]|nr:MFS transporter [Planctomycetota bacterium]